jgi:hypothetical protein
METSDTKENPSLTIIKQTGNVNTVLHTLAPNNNKTDVVNEPAENKANR